MANKDGKKKGLGLPQTKGQFQLCGLSTGTEKDKFYSETLTKTSQKPFRMINFGLQVDKETTIYVNLNGGEQDKVYFSKTITDEKDKKKKETIVEEVAWKDRFKWNKEGFRLIGVNVGVKKIVKDNKTVNDKKSLTPYDACKEISDNIKDDQSLFIKGNIDYSHFDSNGNTRRAVKFIPNQVSLCSKDVNFDAEDFISTNFFTQTIVFTGIEQDQEDKNKFIVSAKIIGFNSVEDAEFIILDKNLAGLFKKNLKPYWSLTVSGKINMSKDVEEITNNDECWGEENKMNKINAPMIRELIITGADPKSIDKDTYSEKLIEEAMAKINVNKRAENDYGSGENWGSSSNLNGDNSSDDAWD